VPGCCNLFSEKGLEAWERRSSARSQSGRARMSLFVRGILSNFGTATWFRVGNHEKRIAGLGDAWIRAQADMTVR
jgi:hypothetical protein